jgi:hypothetical protein
MKNINVTILPWRVFSEPREGDLHPLVSIFRDHKTKRDLVCNHCTPEDAKFIVQAVNEYADLREACKSAMKSLRKIDTRTKQGEDLFAEIGGFSTYRKLELAINHSTEKLPPPNHLAP